MTCAGCSEPVEELVEPVYCTRCVALTREAVHALARAMTTYVLVDMTVELMERSA